MDIFFSFTTISNAIEKTSVNKAAFAFTVS